MQLLKHRMVSNVDVLAPLYICSIGCHVFNIVNKKSKVYNEGALSSDSRLHVIMVSVPGFGKSYMLRHFLDSENGIISKTKMKPRFCASMTTASFIGSIKTGRDGEPLVHRGLADKYNDSVLGIHEFAELTNSMKQTYNVGLIDALLSALDDGKIVKDVVAGEITYETMITLFSAVQPARYDLTSGLGRRLAFLVYIPTLKDMDELRKLRRRARSVSDNKELLDKIRRGIDGLYDVCKQIRSIRFSQSFYDWMDRNNIIHYEEVIYERIAVGYNIMKFGVTNSELVVRVDDDLIKVFERQKMDRYSVKSGVGNDQVWRVIKEAEVVRKEDVVDILLSFSLSRETIESKLRSLAVLKYIQVNGDYIKVIKK